MCPGCVCTLVITLVSMNFLQLYCYDTSAPFTIGFVMDDMNTESEEVTSSIKSWGDVCCHNVSTNVSTAIIQVKHDDIYSLQTSVYRSNEVNNVTVVAVSSCSNALMVDSLTAPQAPVFAVTPLYCQSAGDLNTNVDEIRYQVGSLRDILPNIEWHEMIVLYSSMHEYLISELEQAMPSHSFNFYEISDTQSSSILQTLISSHDDNHRHVNTYLVLFSPDITMEVIKLIQDFGISIGHQGYISYFSEWLVLAELDQLDDLLIHTSDLLNIAFIVSNRPFPTSNATELLLGNLEVISNTINENYADCDTTQTSTEECSIYYKIPGDCHDDCDTITVYSALGISNSTSSREAWPTAKWNPLHGLDSSMDIFPCKTYGFNRMVLKVATIERKPFVSKNESDGDYYGFLIAMLEEIAIKLNFTYELVTPPDGMIGVQGDDEQWSGILGMLQRKEVDLLLAPVELTPETEKIVDFTFPYYMDSYGVIYRRTDPAKMKYRLFIEPFRWKVWVCMGASVAFTGIMVYVVSRYTPYYDKFAIVCGLDHFQHSLWFSASSLVQQSAVHIPYSWSGRFVVGFWWIFCVIMCAVYTGNLIAFLTVTIEFKPFNSIEELVYDEPVTYGILGGSLLQTLLENSNNHLYEKMWHAIQRSARTDPDVLSNSTTTHIHKVLGGRYAFFSDRTTLDISMEGHCDEIGILEQSFWLIQYGIGLPEGSSYTNMFSHVIMKLHQNGLLELYKQRHWPRKVCATESSREAKAVSADDLQGPYGVCAIILLSSLVAFVAEIIWNRHRTRRAVTASSTGSDRKIVDWENETNKQIEVARYQDDCDVTNMKQMSLHSHAVDSDYDIFLSSPDLKDMGKLDCPNTPREKY